MSGLERVSLRLYRVVVEHLSELARDARYGARMLARSPGSTLAAAGCLGLGIGLTASTFTQLKSTVLRQLPAVGRPSELVRLQTPVSFSSYEELRDRSGQFAWLAAYLGPAPFVLTAAGGDPERVWGHLATPDYFGALGVEAAAGRLFGPDEWRPGAAPVAVISDRLWRSRFGGQRSAIGRAIRINGQPATVIGVAPKDFLGASPLAAAADVWIPTTAPAGVAPELGKLRDPRAAAFALVGRLKPGVSYAQAEAALEGLVRRFERVHDLPDKDRKERRVRLLPGGRLLPIRDEDLPAAMGFPVVMVSLILLMACGNVAHMLLARGAARRREMAVRRALGAGRGRIVRQLLTEHMMLAGLGGAIGLLLARWSLSSAEAIRPIIPGYMHLEWQFDWQSLAFAVLLTAAVGLLFGLAPALAASREDISAALKLAAPSRLRVRRWFSLRNVLVFQQVVASMVLLLLTGFVVVGFRRSTSMDIGYESKNLYLMSLDPVRDGYDPRRAAEFFDTLPRRLGRVPGVVGVSVAQTLPLALSSSGEAIIGFKVEMLGGPKSLGAVRGDRVSAGFFDTVGIQLLSGRGFTERDQRDDAHLLVVNATMAKQVWGGENPVGRSVEFEGKTHEVIGVVRDIRFAVPLAPAQAAMYRPVSPSGFASPSARGVTVLVRVEPGFDAATRLRREIAAIDPEVTVFQVGRMADEVEQMFYVVRVATAIYGGAGLYGLILASVGLAGITAYAVARRTHEIGIRMALGARQGDVLRLVLREGVIIVLAGTTAGLAVALAAMRALASILHALERATRTSTSDPLLLAGVPALLAGVALLACYLPARRSMRIDPTAALRAE